MKEAVRDKFEMYPELIARKLNRIRELILEVVSENGLGEVEETLKWGEPSYLVNGGSTVRFDWKAKNPDRYAVYFNCNTRLVDTFKEIYGDLFAYEGNRAILFGTTDSIHEEQLKHCIKLSLTYHKIKHLPLLGT